MENEEKKYFITGNTFVSKTSSKSLAANGTPTRDSVVPLRSERSRPRRQKLVPAGALKDTSSARLPIELKDQLKELGAKWDPESRPVVSHRQRSRRQGQQPDRRCRQTPLPDRMAHDVKDQLKALGCQWDGDCKAVVPHGQRKWPARAQAVVDKGPEKHFIQGNCYPFTEQLKALDCRWDPEAKAWYHLDKEVAAKAQDLVSNGHRKALHTTKCPIKLNEQLKQMGCRWDPEARSWYHSDPAVGRASSTLVQEHREKTQGHEPQLNKRKLASSLAAEIDRGLY